jgi:serine O-acetyltransferase
MPKIFFLDHPVGTVLGKANYGEGFTFAQNCTVGNNKGKYPVFGLNVRMKSGSKVLGDCMIGDNVIISANTYIKDMNIPKCSIVFGSSPNLIIKTKPEIYFLNV